MAMRDLEKAVRENETKCGKLVQLLKDDSKDDGQLS